MMSSVSDRLAASLSTVAHNGRDLNYGTAGFRTRAEFLKHAVLRCGHVSCVRSLANSGAATGLCITASHNPEEDNGVKIVEPDGSMLPEDFEADVTTYVNARDNAVDVFRLLIERTQDRQNPNVKASYPMPTFSGCKVVVGRDTRGSSPELARLAVDGVESLGATAIDIGVVTTPMLHWITAYVNGRLSCCFVAPYAFPAKSTDKPLVEERAQMAAITAAETSSTQTTPEAHAEKLEVSLKLPRTPVEALLHAYFDHFIGSTRHFVHLYNLRGETNSAAAVCQSSKTWQPIKAICDCACGVGGLHIDALESAFKALNVELSLRNDRPNAGATLNDHCGAEYVQKERKLPAGFGVAHGDAPGACAFSLDGDADRVIFFQTPAEGAPLGLIDGDAVAVVIVSAVSKLFQRVDDGLRKRAGEKAEGMVDEITGSSGSKLTMGVVQTAYANGATCAKLTEMAFPAFVDWSCTMSKTGVKNMHRIACQFAIGVYFESNGHGTVVVDFAALDAWAASYGLLPNDQQPSAAEDIELRHDFELLKAFLMSINHCVGDAMVDALTFFLSLRVLQMTPAQVLDPAFLSPLEVVQRKVRMDRAKLNLLKCQPEHEGFLLEPQDLQAKIDAAISALDPRARARAFVRPSGTEDVCRIYAEAATLTNAENLAQVCESLLNSFNAV